MNILFIHQNFPGQFVHLAPALAARGHKVIGLADEANKNPTKVQTYYYRTPEKDRLTGIGATYAETSARGDMVAGACSQLRDRTGFHPDLIVGHNGWGEMLFVREVWPEARLVNYAELVYRTRGLDSDFDPEFRNTELKMRTIITARAAHILQSMVEADAALSPTHWQAASFPPVLRDKITVIHDGVDTDIVRPNPKALLKLPGGRQLRAGDEVLSFVNRNLEPYRGFHSFMRALPDVMAARPKAQVVILGGDKTGYGRAAPNGSWKQTLLDEVGDRLDPARLHFLGRVPYETFLALLQVTRVHAYLTYPFVLSWSMIEAMSAGAHVVGSRTGPVEEVIEDGVNGTLVDFFDIPGWSKTLIEALANPSAADGIRRAARETVLARYDLQRDCLPRLVAFVESMAPGA
ncbi:MAG: glycosyltransferase [Paracoccaceae bacterium]